jgi:hypothetical protein
MAGCAVEALGQQNATNEANIFRENETNEPNVGPLSVVRGLLLMAGCAVEALGQQSVTNEPTAAGKNATNELKLAVDDGVGHSVELRAGANDGDEKNFEEGFTVEESEAIRRGCEKVRLARVESLRKLNEEARREAEAAMAIRRSRLREQRKQKGKLDGPPMGRAAGNEQTSKTGRVGGNKKELDQLTDMVLELKKQTLRART